MKGKLYGVSVGPGDPELITVKALKAISDCSVIAAPKTAGGGMTALAIAERAADLSGKKILSLECPMTNDKSLRKENRMNMAAQIFSELDSGSDTAVLCLGDISVYSTFSYILDEALAKGYETQLIPGVTSFCAAAAEVKQPLVQGERALILMPPSCGSFDELLSIDAEKVIMKCGSQMNRISEKLIHAGAQICAVENCGMENQRIISDPSELLSCGYYTVIYVRDSV